MTLISKTTASRLAPQYEMLLASIEVLKSDLCSDREYWAKKPNTEGELDAVIGQLDNQLCVLHHLSHAVKGAFS